jgi:inorganic phosphate transporter, PiT family
MMGFIHHHADSQPLRTQHGEQSINRRVITPFSRLCRIYNRCTFNPPRCHMSLIVLLLAVVCLAYANGANDNFKGVATLFGSGTTNFMWAVAWATLTTLAGSLIAVVLAEQLLRNFSGKGLVSDSLVSDFHYVAAVAAGAGLTVLLATRLGMPISTTHSLIGALIGAGWAAGSAVHIGKLGSTFFLPLLLSPVLALVATCLLYPAFRLARRWVGVTEETCLCVGSNVVEVIPALSGDAILLQRVEQLSLSVGTTVVCQHRYQGQLLGIKSSTLLNGLHYLSAGVVSFARGLNDTPKIAALMLLAPQFGRLGSIVLVGAVIAIGGILSVRWIAETMSQKITPMNHGQGFTANLITGIIVVGASQLGLPVSTTHVSCGSLFGIGTLTGKGNFRMMATILLAWITTLPLGALSGAICFWTLRSL